MKFISLLMLSILLNACSSMKQPNRTIDLRSQEGQGSYFQLVNGGAPGSGSSIDLFVEERLISADTVEEAFMTLGKDTYHTKQYSVKEGGVVFYFRTEKQDITMDINPQKEYGNTLKSSSKEPPFSLNDREAAIKIDGQWLKLTHVAMRQTINYPSSPRGR